MDCCQLLVNCSTAKLIGIHSNCMCQSSSSFSGSMDGALPMAQICMQSLQQSSPRWLMRPGNDPQAALLHCLQIITERAAAVIGNLSLGEEYFTAIRESGALQTLVSLLDSGPNSRITEIAAKTLANMAVKDSNRTGIRLAGGIPPLMRLLLERPSEQVGAWLHACRQRAQLAELKALARELTVLQAGSPRRSVLSLACLLCSTLR